MILVDSSVWIAEFRHGDPVGFRGGIDLDDVVTCLPVIQEVLQGFRLEDVWRRARNAMLALTIIESPLRIEVVEEAVSLFRQVRRGGMTIRSTADCLIAACALRNDLEVLHVDRDFAAIAKICGLKQRQL